MWNKTDFTPSYISIPIKSIATFKNKHLHCVDQQVSLHFKGYKYLSKEVWFNI